jgi:hypothetical protein
MEAAGGKRQREIEVSCSAVGLSIFMVKSQLSARNCPDFD